MSFNTTHINFVPIKGTSYGFYSNRKLGEGYGGAIYEGINIHDSSSIAVKILNSNSLIQNHIPFSEMVHLTSQSYLKQQQLPFKENSLVKIIDVIQLDKTIIIMQLCNCNLSQFLQSKKQFKENQILTIFINIVQALLISQRAGYHFSDLKPENILITKQGKIKLGDLQSLIALHDSNKKNKLKFHNSIFGTLHYMPPQLIGLGEHSQKNYIWTLGVILHQILYKQPPFKFLTQNSEINELEKQENINFFYQSLFNLKICDKFSKEYPKCQYLLKNMLRFNAKNRISLQKIYEYLTHTEINFEISSKSTLKCPQIQRQRSISQNTADTSIDEIQSIKRQKQDYKCQKSENNISIRLQNDHNQKQNEIQNLSVQYLKVKYHQKHQKQTQINEYQNNWLQQIFELIILIERPLIMLKKLQQLRMILNEINKRLIQLKINKNNNNKQQQIKKIINQIRLCRAYSHLQKTYKLSTTQNDIQRNQKQITLWNHLNQFISSISNNN